MHCTSFLKQSPSFALFSANVICPALKRDTGSDESSKLRKNSISSLLLIIQVILLKNACGFISTFSPRTFTLALFRTSDCQSFRFSWNCIHKRFARELISCFFPKIICLVTVNQWISNQTIRYAYQSRSVFISKEAMQR